MKLGANNFPHKIERRHSLFTMSRKTMSDDWRRYGEARRKELIEKDEMEGRTSFTLNRKCPVKGYFRLAERVVGQFKLLCNDPATQEDAYVMGHRLAAFLSQALPKHPDFMNKNVSVLRDKTFRDLAWIHERMEKLALSIDEDELNKYITDEFVPEPDDDESSSASSEGGAVQWTTFGNSNQWESFPRWSFDVDCSSDQPGMVDTDASSFEQNHSRESDSELDEVDIKLQQVGLSQFVKGGMDDEQHETFVSMFEEPEEELFPEFYEENPEFPPVDFEEEQDEHDDDEEEEYHDARYTLSDAIHVSEFLRKVASEDVRYETDSEAADSWAQDGDSTAFSGASSSGILTCDPARFALREILNSSPLKQKRGTPPFPPAPPSNSPATPDSKSRFSRREEDVGWANFDFASVRQAVE